MNIFSKTLAVAALSVAAGTSYAAEIIGNDLLDRAVTDSASTTYVAHVSFSASEIGNSLTSWSFFTEAYTTGRSITPLLFERSSGDNYILQAIGETRTIGSGGVVTGLNEDLGFNTQVGDATILSANYFFGWKDGTQTSANQGVISFGGGGSTLVTSFPGNSTQNVTGADVDTTLLLNRNLGNRIYSYQAKTEADTASVPLPASISLLILGFMGLRARSR